MSEEVITYCPQSGKRQRKTKGDDNPAKVYCRNCGQLLKVRKTKRPSVKIPKHTVWGPEGREGKRERLEAAAHEKQWSPQHAKEEEQESARAWDS